MNDPGLDKSTTQAAEDVEANNTQYDQNREQAEEEEQEFLKPGYANYIYCYDRELLIFPVDGGSHLQRVR